MIFDMLVLMFVLREGLKLKETFLLAPLVSFGGKNGSFCGSENAWWWMMLPFLFGVFLVRAASTQVAQCFIALARSLCTVWECPISAPRWIVSTTKRTFFWKLLSLHCYVKIQKLRSTPFCVRTNLSFWSSNKSERIAGFKNLKGSSNSLELIIDCNYVRIRWQPRFCC